jgi:hypothetical protein
MLMVLAFGFVVAATGFWMLWEPQPEFPLRRR